MGKPHTLWVAFAKLYERHGDLPNARIICEKAVQVGTAGGPALLALLLVSLSDLRGAIRMRASLRGRPNMRQRLASLCTH